MAGAPTASAVSADTPAGRCNANRTIRKVTRYVPSNPAVIAAARPRSLVSVLRLIVTMPANNISGSAYSKTIRLSTDACAGGKAGCQPAKKPNANVTISGRSAPTTAFIEDLPDRGGRAGPRCPFGGRSGPARTARRRRSLTWLSSFDCSRLREQWGTCRALAEGSADGRTATRLGYSRGPRPAGFPHVGAATWRGPTPARAGRWLTRD